ncbi:IS30 family transposase (plasmid) [Klebsiella sp. WOUb02]|uniref:IS30 family transposase n=1 Tax=Klebsiella sp. WOUb02 TaxID=3161071 RepID=UPI003CF30222
MKYQQLTEGLRYQIALLCEDKVSQTEIARRSGVSKSTVSRELLRNRSVDGYQPAAAQKLSTSRRKAAGKRRMHEDTVFFVEAALNWLWSPEQISAVGRIIGMPVSHEWIYQHVQADKASGGDLYKLLRQGKRRYRKGYGKKRSPIPDAVSIEQRPAVVEARTRPGDREADLVPGKQGTGAIVTLVERKSRIYLTKKVFSKDSAEVATAIISMLSGYKDVCRTITFDNGGEFTQHKEIAAALETETCFAHPYASWERGLNENTNGLLRQFIPKGTDLTAVTDDELRKYQGALNSRPRKCPGFRQPSVVFAELRKAA